MLWKNLDRHCRSVQLLRKSLYPIAFTSIYKLFKDQADTGFLSIHSFGISGFEGWIRYTLWYLPLSKSNTTLPKPTSGEINATKSIGDRLHSRNNTQPCNTWKTSQIDPRPDGLNISILWMIIASANDFPVLQTRYRFIQAYLSIHSSSFREDMKKWIIPKNWMALNENTQFPLQQTKHKKESAIGLRWIKSAGKQPTIRYSHTKINPINEIPQFLRQLPELIRTIIWGCNLFWRRLLSRIGKISIPLPATLDGRWKTNFHSGKAYSTAFTGD